MIDFNLKKCQYFYLCLTQEYAKYLHEREQEKIEQARQRRLQKRIERERQEMQRIQGDIESGRAQEGQMESSGAVAGKMRDVNTLTFSC